MVSSFFGISKPPWQRITLTINKFYNRSLAISIGNTLNQKNWDSSKPLKQVCPQARAAKIKIVRNSLHKGKSGEKFRRFGEDLQKLGKYLLTLSYILL